LRGGGHGAPHDALGAGAADDATLHHALFGRRLLLLGIDTFGARGFGDMHRTPADHGAAACTCAKFSQGHTNRHDVLLSRPFEHAPMLRDAAIPGVSMQEKCRTKY
jgi:hypothetical protein